MQRSVSATGVRGLAGQPDGDVHRNHDEEGEPERAGDGHRPAERPALPRRGGPVEERENHRSEPQDAERELEKADDVRDGQAFPARVDDVERALEDREPFGPAIR